jgi:hypothetical protein
MSRSLATERRHVSLRRVIRVHHAFLSGEWILFTVSGVLKAPKNLPLLGSFAAHGMRDEPAQLPTPRPQSRLLAPLRHRILEFLRRALNLIVASEGIAMAESHGAILMKLFGFPFAISALVGNYRLRM